MTTPSTHRRRLSPPASNLDSSSSSSSQNPAATASSPYFLPELISQIASRLTTLHDFFALRATYRDLLPPSPSSLASQAPHLLLVPGSRALFHLPLRRHLRFRLPLPLPDTDPTAPAAAFYSLGCRVAIVSPSHHDLSFVHLLTGEQFRLPHPPADFCRLLLSGDLVLAFLPTVGHVLQYCRLGDAEWRMASCSESYVLEDLIFVKGTLHALVRSQDAGGLCYRLAVVKLSDTNSVEFTFLGGRLDTQAAHESSYFCLAECLDELLLVGATGDTPEKFHVFRWQSGDGEGRWTRTASLGGCTMFLSYFHFANRMRYFGGFFFASCLGPDHPGFRRDYLYLRVCLV
ncbi:hypothetical protein D1007_26288 [Hordeum vulgare]|uniref:uncharacterized protein LOC123428858 n=1 Tax=Hordeum vulgare subsp. vulgare TaxID=112509 RepID=UPI001D1A4BB5|nr:uncharacterized protein LOC123428858 [Hordeum vulgare subsp. vulgare]KAE8798425.1 hypothetical protein D1007_26288 [Hordeum vulgare]